MSPGQRRLREGEAATEVAQLSSHRGAASRTPAVTCHTKGCRARRCSVRAMKQGGHPCGAGWGGGGAVLSGSYREPNAVMADSIFEPQLHGWEAVSCLRPLAPHSPPPAPWVGGGWFPGSQMPGRLLDVSGTPDPSQCRQHLPPGDQHWARDGLLRNADTFHSISQKPNRSQQARSHAHSGSAVGSPLQKDTALGSVRPAGGVAGATLSKMSAQGSLR